MQMRRRRTPGGRRDSGWLALLTATVVVGVAAACGPTDTGQLDTASANTSDPATSAAPSSSSAGSSAAAPTTPAPTTAVPVDPGPPPVNAVVVVDPGHNGLNAANPDIINAPVPDGTGGTKPCNTTGTATNDGYPEHAFTWDVAIRVRDALAARGVTVVMTRPDDAGVGPCVDVRAAIGNDNAATAVVSIHGDGTAAGNRGIYCMESSMQPAGAEIGAQSHTLAAAVKDAVVGTGVLPVSNYFGTVGVGPRSDLAGLNLSQRPTTMCELGNMRDPDDAAVMMSEDGRAQIAAGIAAGVLTYLGA